MSRADNGQRSFLSFGNPFKRITPKGSYQSLELIRLQNSFEESLANRLRDLLKMESSILSLSWMTSAMESLSETHASVQSLITDLQFPVSDWDEQWMNVYLDDSVKLLDICNGFTSEISRLDQNQLFLKHTLHLLGKHSGCHSEEQVEKVFVSLSEWMRRTNPRSPKLNNSSSILQGLANSLYLTKVKNSAKGKVLMRAMYGVKVHTIFICSVFSAILSGSPHLLINLPVSDVFLWGDAFDKLQDEVSREVRGMHFGGSSSSLDELGSVDKCVEKLTSLMGGRGKREAGAAQSSDLLNSAALKECVSNLDKSADQLFNALDAVSNKLNSFFNMVLAGRDALVYNLRMPQGKKGCQIYPETFRLTNTRPDVRMCRMNAHQ